MRTPSPWSPRVLGPPCSIQPSSFLSVSASSLCSLGPDNTMGVCGMEQMALTLALLLMSTEDVCSLAQVRKALLKTPHTRHTHTYHPTFAYTWKADSIIRPS